MEIARSIKVPEPITIAVDGKATDLKVSFQDLVLFLVNGDTRFNSSGVGIRSGLRIEEAVKSPESVVLSQDDWKRLCDVAESPDCGMPKLSNGVHIGRQLMPFLDAIACAEEIAQ